MLNAIETDKHGFQNLIFVRVFLIFAFMNFSPDMKKKKEKMTLYLGIFDLPGAGGDGSVRSPRSPRGARRHELRKKRTNLQRKKSYAGFFDEKGCAVDIVD